MRNLSTIFTNDNAKRGLDKEIRKCEMLEKKGNKRCY